MQFLAPLFSRIRQGFELLVAVLLGSMFAAFIIQVVFRYILNWPVGWTIEYVAVAWLWGILLGYAFVVRDEDVVRFDLFYNAFGQRARRGMTIVSGIVVAGIFLWALPKDFEFVTFMGVEKTAFMHMRFDILFAAYIPFVIAVIVRALWEVRRALRNEPENNGAQHFNPESESHV